MDRTNISSSDDMIDIRDIIEYVEELEQERETLSTLHEMPENARKALAEWDISHDGKEFKLFSALLDELKGNGDDEQWRGAWYPVTLIRDGYFADYAAELAKDIGAVGKNAHWPLNCIDWSWAAQKLQVDCSWVMFDGIKFWYR